MSQIVVQTETRRSRASGAALIDKACDVLETVASRPDGMRHAELAASTGLTRTTLYRILAVLTARGLLRQDPARKTYALGFRLTEAAGPHGAFASAGTELALAAAAELRGLRDLTGETTYLGTLEGREVVSLSRFEGRHEIRSAAALGQRKPLHCTSQGKAIMAFLPAVERDALVRRLPLPGLTRQTITDQKRLLGELAVTAARGFSMDDEEIVVGVRCVGAPVLDGEGRVHGAISIAGPAWRMTRERLALLGPEVTAAGRRIGAQLRVPAALSAGSPQPVAGPVAFAGLSPRWNGESLWWCDRLGPDLRLTDAEGTRLMPLRGERPLLALAPVADGGAAAIDDSGRIAVIDRHGVERAAALRPDFATLGALRVRPGGEPWAAMRSLDGAGCVGLLRAGRFDEVYRLPGSVGALCWSPKGDSLFATVPERGTIFELRIGRSAPLVVTELPAGGGRPRGLAVDEAGGIWVALDGGWSVVRLNGMGEIEQVVPVPVARPLDLCFGGPAMNTLFIVSGRDGLPLEVIAAAPLSGRLLAVIVEARGAPEPLLVPSELGCAGPL